LREVEDVLISELDRLAGGSITEAELGKAIKQSRAQLAYATERVTNQAYWLGWAQTITSYTWVETYLDRLAAVTIEDVGRVARTYLRPSNRTVGWYVPEAGVRHPA
jgi:zinc protease